MKDKSHKLMFMAATAAMYVAVLYGSETGLALLVPGGPWRIADLSPLTPVLAAFSTDPHSAEPNQPPADQPGSSVLPNAASCPAASALAAPPSVGDAIGKDEPQLTKDASTHPQNSGVLGTGAGCPRLRADAGTPRIAPLAGTMANAANRPQAAPNPQP